MLTVLAFLLGCFVWTFLEYVIHNFLGHHMKGRGIISREHMMHHARVDYFTSLAKKMVLAVLVIGLLSLLGAQFVRPALAGAFATGVGGGWMLYEVLHRRLHVIGPRGLYLEWACRHHFHHHFASPNMNHGVTTPIWDLLLGTYERPEVVRVPERQAHKLPWLSAEGKPGVQPSLEGRYQIVAPHG